MRPDWLERSAPYVTAVCATALLAFVVTNSTRAETTAGTTSTDVVIGGAATQVTTPGAVNASGGAGSPPVAGGPSAVAGGQSAVPGAATPSASGPAGTDSAVAAVAGSGMGTPEALANPDCDPATGKIRFPSVFAPPCVAEWPDGADNGGATSDGVTADAIRVAVLLPPDSPSNTTSDADHETEIRASLDVFESHYELWGRKLDLHFYKSSGTDEIAQRADATSVYSDGAPFAAFAAGQNPFPVWFAELAARGVMTFTLTEQWQAMQDQAGLRWGANTDDHLTWAHAAEYVAKRLQGRPAQWSGSETDAVKERVIGVLHPDSWDQAFMKQQAEAAGAQIALMVGYPDGDLVELQNRVPTLIARLKDAGVTTVVSAVDIVSNAAVTREATKQVFTPEWVVTGWGNQDTALAGRLFDQHQWSHAFGFGPVQPLTPPEEHDVRNMYRWHHGRDSSNPGITGQVRLIAHGLMTGIHVTGPNLTPQTFRDARFAAPPAGGSACGCRSTVMVSYGRHIGVPWDDYSGFDDMTEKWWDPTTTGADEVGVTAAGVYWKVDGGRRYFPGQWPTGEPKMFITDGAVERFDTTPPDEKIPPYEHEPH